jgi:hypothetical protein
MATTLLTHKEVQAVVWAALKWVVGVGLALAFGLGVWASTLRADVNHALEGVTASARVERQLDSLRIEMRHVTDVQQEILTTLKGR